MWSEATALVVLSIAIIGMSMWASPRHVSVDGFFGGRTEQGHAPKLWTLVLSQVTTWIFARSLLTAAILGYYYGVAGALAYTAYYLSFLTGGYIVSALRAKGARSFQDYLRDEYGSTGPLFYNIVIALRLMSEVFANLLVVGLLFSAAFGGEFAGKIAMVATALVALGYSSMGGLRASLRTDVVQMIFFIIVFVLAFLAMVFSNGFSFGAVLSAPGVSGGYNGWVLLLVAFLQVVSYPAHDPVMMDRGFLADDETTKKSFLHAFWISALCIFGFALFGVEASVRGEELGAGGLLESWKGMFGSFVWFLIAASLLVSAMSTLDSALASSARLAIEELGLGARTTANGRIAMAAFMLGGVLFLLGDTKTLFDAVAVSGTASMFLAPVIVLGLWMGRSVPVWAYVLAFVAAIGGAVAYFFQSEPLVIALFGEGHKYERLLAICVSVHVIGFGAAILGRLLQRRVES